MIDYMLKFDKVSFGYDDFLVLKNISFQINRGDFIGIKGFNGAGKTTLIKLMLKILKQSKGQILYSKDMKKAHIGYVRQNVDNSYNNFPASVIEVVNLGLYPKGGIFNRLKEDDYKKVLDVMEKLEITQYAKNKISKLSGGQRQKVFIAKSLVNRPNLLILDEPDSGLDEKSSVKIFDIIKKLNNLDGLTLLVISHNIEILDKYAKKMYELNRGEIKQLK